MLEVDEMKRVHCRMCAGSTWVCASLIAMSIFALSCSSSPSPTPESTSPPAPPVAERATSQEPPPSPVPTATPEPEKRATALAVPVAASNAAQSPSPASQDEQPSASAATSTPERTPVPAARRERLSGSSDTANTLPPAATSTGVSATSTEQVVDDDSPLGDCFGGVLSGEYVHCYILEQARSQGLIDVVAVYEVRDNWLFVSIRGDVSAELGRFVREKTKEFMYEIARTLKDASLPGGSVYGQYFEQGCPTSPSGPFPGCYVSYNIGDLNVPPGWFLPATLGYRYGVEFVPGGDAGRRQVVGWAGWRQVWPAVVSGASGVSGASTTFDVSDVDMTNLPDATSEHGFAGSKGGGSTLRPSQESSDGSCGAAHTQTSHQPLLRYDRSVYTDGSGRPDPDEAVSVHLSEIPLV